MRLTQIGMQRLLRISSSLIVLGLAVEIGSLSRFHPLTFMLFGFVVIGLIGAGMLVYLASLLFVAAKPPTERGG